ncbi:hypothetical protein [Stenotrophomonas muris]|uniref:hypothetical protein n=1 Tax=Stenotrophomonas muris TaxID=2963283 RepID=UPI00383A6523
MKALIYGAAQLAAMAAAIASRCVPKTSLELRTPRKVSDAGFAVIREGIVQLVLGGVGIAPNLNPRTDPASNTHTLPLQT